MMQPSTLHIVFSISFAETLQEVLTANDRTDRIALLTDNLSHGPIDSVVSTNRLQWLNQQLGAFNYTDPGESEANRWEEAIAATTAFRTASRPTDNNQPVAWFSRRDANSYAGFLWWLAQHGNAPCNIVDVTDIVLPAHKGRGRTMPAHRAVSPSLIPPRDLGPLFNLARPLQPAERQHYLDMWQLLVTENAPLRITDGTRLISAPIDYFDPLLLSFVVENWRKMARIIAEAMMQQMGEQLHQTGDMFLGRRLEAIAEAGIVDYQGDLKRMRYCELRLPVGPTGRRFE